VSQALIEARDLDQVFRAIVDLAVGTVAGAEHAGVTRLRRGTFETPAATGPLPRQVDAIQYELGSGPCVDAVLDGAVYRSGDLANDTRWPEFGKRAATETGVKSMIAIRFYLEHDDTLAGLNLYSTQPDAFDDQGAQTTVVLATHAAVAMVAAQRKDQITNLNQALEASREIGIGMGVLMAKQLLTRDQAFDLLRIASQHTHRKLRDIARDVADTGALDLPPG
jgi:transcriptional regulator with GAF, ATPase, and Fis domain